MMRPRVDQEKELAKRKRRVSRRKSKNKSDETKSRPREGTC